MKSEESDSNTSAEPQKENENEERGGVPPTPKRKTFMDVAIQVTGTMVVLLGVALAVVSVVNLKHKESYVLWLGFATVVFALLGLTLYWQKRMWDNAAALAAEAAAASFEVTLGTVLGQEQRDFNAMFWASYQSKFGPTLSPIHRTMVIRLTNRQSVRSMIETYRVEAQNARGEWVKLLRIDGQRSGIFALMGSPKQAMHVDMKALDSVLSSGIIHPKETVEGAAFFELPENLSFGQPLRIYVKDFGGAEVTQPLAQPTDFAQGWRMLPSKPVDLSDHTIKFYSETLP